MNSIKPKIILSIVAFAIILFRHLFPNFKIDAIDLGLIVLMILPWFSGLIKGMELPGGFKVEFQDVKDAGNKIVGESLETQTRQIMQNEEIFISTDHNVNLALVSLRIEIEKRIQKLNSIYDIEDKSDVPSLLYKLRKSNVLSESELQGLRNIVMFGNRAAHGVSVDPRVLEWARNEGPKILAILDSKIEKSNKN